MDLVGEAISAMRTGDPQAARALLKPPWGLRFNAAGGAGVQVILRGEAWLLPPDGGEPIHMSGGRRRADPAPAPARHGRRPKHPAVRRD